MEAIAEFLPFLIPLIALQLALYGYTLFHILTHDTYKRGSRGLWLAVSTVLMAYIGPFLYFLLGKEEE